MSEIPRKTIKFTTTTGVLYVGCVAAIYQHTFWTRFQINILSYISLSDMVKLALWPFMGFVLAWLAGALLGATSAAPKPLPDSAKRFRGLRLFLRRHGSFAGVTVNLVGATVLLYVMDSPAFWLTLAALVAVVSHFLLSLEGSLSHFFEDEMSHRIGLALLTLFPGMAWGMARYHSESIQEGVVYERVNASPAFRASAAILASAELRYLGNTGTYTLMLIDGGPEVVIVRNEELGAIKLLHVSNEDKKKDKKNTPASVKE